MLLMYFHRCCGGVIGDNEGCSCCNHDCGCVIIVMAMVLVVIDDMIADVIAIMSKVAVAICLELRQIRIYD